MDQLALYGITIVYVSMYEVFVEIYLCCVQQIVLTSYLVKNIVKLYYLAIAKITGMILIKPYKYFCVIICNMMKPYKCF